ncbi:carbon-phosphorus lyase complex subunit PhnI [Mesorhizobium sp. B4-1-4]|uniref:carbon-phosphorus lyase complex subunit PhnI n=1 Tax=Mesorhizobium sp. B4-1-4 TaxID=2589888 RepID=UPI00112DECE9|nr:carbon-phosphorus lyase complex subunit PhnI [Mesorhizobium sp. B4-1-4]UCI34893.1 carbon-phosphorus lyase complex subunit PhnI [Mesorhizobium sp. B4-1-4]
MITSIKGGEVAIAASHKLISKRRRGDGAVAELTVEQISQQMSLAVDRVMSEGSLYDTTLAALAIKQSEGDLLEAIALVRSFRTTLNRFGYTEPVNTGKMLVRRRIATTHKDVPGGQFLGPTYDYTHRILDFSLLNGSSQAPSSGEISTEEELSSLSELDEESGILARSDIIEAVEGNASSAVNDITREPIAFPSKRDERLQTLTRGDEGFLVGLCYSSMRGYGRNHPFVAELRYGDAEVLFDIPEIGLTVGVGTVRLSECQTIHLTPGDGSRVPQFTRGYGLVLGQGERKAIAMAILDRSLRGEEFGEEVEYPAQNEEFVLSHSDSVASSGLVQHLKLPHYVDFQATMQLLEQMRDEQAKRQPQGFVNGGINEETEIAE